MHPIPVDLIFLYFRALRLNDTYREYADAVCGGDETTKKSIESSFVHLKDLFQLFGNVFEFGENDYDSAEYDLWFSHYKRNFVTVNFYSAEVIKEGEELNPEPGKIYYTITNLANRRVVTRIIQSEIERARKKVNSRTDRLLAPISGTSLRSRAKIGITARRLDVYDWTVRKGLSYKDAVLAAYDSRHPHWKILKNQLRAISAIEGKEVPALTGPSIRIQTTSFQDLRKEGAKLVDNTIKGLFPSVR